jgi:hypothetical protein
LLTRGRFVEQKLMLSSSFRFDKINNCQRFDFSHTLLCYLSRGGFVEQKFVLIYSSRCDPIQNSHSNESEHTLLCCKSDLDLDNKPALEMGLLDS